MAPPDDTLAATDQTLALSGDHLPRFNPERLRGFERVAVPICDAINSRPWLKSVGRVFLRYVIANAIAAISSYRWETYNFETVKSMKPPRGVLLVSNHRSFFDMYVTSALLYKRASFLDRIFFPVRARFFYSHPVGLLVNAVASACAMWPPVFLDDRRQELNPVGQQQMGFALSMPGATMGIHPEGTRGKGPDPYELLDAKPGVGRLVKACHPDTVVLPLFILGMGSELMPELRHLVSRPDHDTSIRLTFGDPVRCGDLAKDRSPLEVSQALLDTVRELGSEDKRRQAALGRAPVPVPVPTSAAD